VRLFLRLTIPVLLGGGLLTTAGPAQAQAYPTNAIVTMNSTGLPGYDYSRPRFGDAGSFLISEAYEPGGFRLTYHTDDPDKTWGIQLAPPAGETFRPGRYPVVDDQPEPGQAYGEIWTTNTTYGYHGDIDVLDWVPGPNGLPSRAHIVFRNGTKKPEHSGYFGEIRINQPGEGLVHLGARNLAWPSTAVGSTRISATEWVHNTSSGAVQVGTPKLAGLNAADWRVTRNGCTGTLAPGATCSLVLGYSPAAGGPRVASLLLPVNGFSKKVSLSGEAPLGTSLLTFGGNDYISGGKTHTYRNGPYVMTAEEDRPYPRVFAFTESVPYDSWDDPEVHMSAPGGGPIPVGTYSTVGTTQTSGTRYGQDTSGMGAGCGSYGGTMTVHAFTVDATGAPSMANIDYKQRCMEEPDRWMTARLLFQYRSDTTPPRAPTAASVSGSSLRWTKSASTDALTSIARLFRGTGPNATPTTGYPISGGSATSATLPKLDSGQTYTIKIFAVDGTGNVSSPLSKTVIG
jgi:hypothetical protein